MSIFQLDDPIKKSRDNKEGVSITHKLKMGTNPQRNANTLLTCLSIYITLT